MSEIKENIKKRIGVLRGGAGKRYHSSLKKGGDIISHIYENLGDKYKPIDILVDKDYIWHFNGIPINPSELVNKVDIVWNTSHQSFSNILESLSILTIGSGSFLGALINNRDMLRAHIKSIGVYMPRHIVLPLYQEDFDGPREKYAIKKAKQIFEKFGAPWIIKSYTPDSNMGMHIAKTFPQLVDSIEDGVNHEKSIVIEEFIEGKPSAVHSIFGLRGEDVYIMPPSDFNSLEKEKIIDIAKNLHQHLGAKHYLKFDFTLHPKRGIFLTNLDFIPDLRPGSHFDQSCESIGAKMHHVVEHILERAL
jgi:D-alanine-D-alanine ligase-like ATP-grasp enzyme